MLAQVIELLFQYKLMQKCLTLNLHIIKLTTIIYYQIYNEFNRNGEKWILTFCLIAVFNEFC
jgi:hypothetical protein